MKSFLLTGSILLLIILSKPVQSSEQLNWNELEFKSASGVPSATQQTYNLKGILHIVKTQSKEKKFLYVTTSRSSKTSLVKSFWADVSGQWDNHKNLATERINFSGELKGQLKSVLKCSKDPWLYQTSCTIVDIKFSTNETRSRDWSGLIRANRQPLTVHKVNLVDATRLAANSVNTPPPPAPPAAETVVTGKSFKKPKKKKPVVTLKKTNTSQIKALKKVKAKELKKTFKKPLEKESDK